MAALGGIAAEHDGSPMDAGEKYPRVILRLKYPVVATSGGGGEITTTSSPLRDVTLLLANTRKDLNRTRIERCKERRALQNQVQCYKDGMKASSRDIEKRLYNAESAATTMARELKESKRRTSSWRREAHEQGEEVKRLRAALEDARSSSARRLADANSASSALALQSRKVEKLSAQLEVEKNAYRMRAGQLRQLKEARKENAILQEAVTESQGMVATAHGAADDLQMELNASKEMEGSLRTALHDQARKAVKAVKAATEMENELEAERQRGACAADACDALVTELKEIRGYSESLAKAASALTVPKFRDVERNDISYRTKARAHQEDKAYLLNIFSERAWRGGDIAAALKGAGLLPEVFGSSEVRCPAVINACLRLY